MQVDCALLCDAVTVREGLLHILGGGVTRVGRSEYPAPLGVALAVRVLIHPTEADNEHHLEARLLLTDGQEVGRVEALFGIKDVTQLQPGELISFSLPMSIQTLPIPSEGAYSFEILIDGVHQKSVPFLAVLVVMEEQE